MILRYPLYILGLLIIIFVSATLFAEKFVIAQHILAKNGYYIFYKKAKEYLLSIDLEDASIYKGNKKVAKVSYFNTGFYPPFTLNASLTCGNGYMDVRENMIFKHIFVQAKHFPISCLFLSSQGTMDSHINLDGSKAVGFMDFKLLNIKGYNVKSLKLNFHKKIFYFRGTLDIYNSPVNVRGDGLIRINKFNLPNSTISGSGIIHTPFKDMHMIIGGIILDPYINIQ